MVFNVSLPLVAQPSPAFQNNSVAKTSDFTFWKQKLERPMGEDLTIVFTPDGQVLQFNQRHNA
jgi:hypothetical protein